MQKKDYAAFLKMAKSGIPTLDELRRGREPYDDRDKLCPSCGTICHNPLVGPSLNNCQKSMRVECCGKNCKRKWKSWLEFNEDSDVVEMRKARREKIAEMKRQSEIEAADKLMEVIASIKPIEEGKFMTCNGVKTAVGVYRMIHEI